MPRYPNSAGSLSDIGGAVYSSLAHRLVTHDGPVYPLHVGDTWLEPADGCRMEDLKVAEHPGMHRYASPQGVPALIEAIAARVGRRTGVEVARESVLVTGGATGGIGAVMGAILDPGDEVLVLAPYWPLITGIIRCFHGTPVEVPFVGPVDSVETAVAAVEHRVTPRTSALYLSTPNNPTGRVFPESWVRALVEWAADNDLWVVSDEVYEDYVYRGEHTYARGIDPQRTFSVHSFSKAFGMAGNRCGYVVGPRRMMSELCKVSTHSFYSTPTASQLAALRALDGRGDSWVAGIKGRYRQLGDRAAERLGVDPPEGSTFLFLDLSGKMPEGGLLGLLEDCADRGLFLAPGPSFGSYPNHARVCFTSAKPELVERGVEILAEILSR
ncbi:MAG: pyridoxal phosphate-dependent aminotransferase [bacterium]|nr:pyridoxal phosphate-dependent aminotransferase [bacterium]